MNSMSRGIRNAFRNPVRAFAIIIILSLSVGLALAMLIAYRAVGDRIETVKSSVGNTISISPAGVRGFEGGGNALTEDDIAKVAKLDHVTSVDKSLNDRLDTSNTNLQSAVDAGNLGRRFAGNNGQGFMFRSDGAGPGGTSTGGNAPEITRTFTPPVTVIGTTDPTALSDTLGGGTFKLTSGEVFANDSTDNVAVIGASLASKNNLQVGSTFTAYGTTVKVVGIYDSGNTFSNNQVIMPLATVQKLSSQAGAVTSATVHIDSVTNIDSVTSAVSSTLGSAADVTNGAEQAKAAVEPLENIQKISLYSLIGAVVAGAVIILLTMIMIVRERRREIGVIKAIGASNVKVMLQFMVEAVTLTLTAAVVGIGLGALGSNPITKLLVDNSTNSNTGPETVRASGAMVRTFTAGPGRGVGRAVESIHTTVGWSILVYGLAVALVIALVGSAVASFFIAKVRPAEVMRSE